MSLVPFGNAAHASLHTIDKFIIMYRFLSARTIQFLSLSVATLCCSLTIALAQTNASMSTSITSTTHEGQEALSIRQFGASATSEGNTTFNFDELFSVDSGSFDNSEWVLQRVIVRLRLDAVNQSLNITNSGESTFTASDTNNLELSYNWVTFTIDTNTFDEKKLKSIEEGQFPRPVLRIPNGTEIAGNGGTFELNPENPVQSTEIEFNVSNSLGGGFSDYDGTGVFNWTFFTNPTFTTSGAGDNLISTSNTGLYGMLPQVEYIVIPEPGALGLMLIALGTAGGFAIARMWKKA